MICEFEVWWNEFEIFDLKFEIISFSDLALNIRGSFFEFEIYLVLVFCYLVLSFRI